MKPLRLPLAAALLAAAPAFAATTLTFEDVTSFASIAGFYNGGTDSAGASGANLGVAFGADALGLKNDALGPYFSNAPSPIGTMTPVGNDAAMDVAVGFTGTVSFYYSASQAVANGVQVWSGLGGSGALLASFNLLDNAQAGGCSSSPFCNFSLASTSFAGTARSITFGNSANAAIFDNVSVTPVPEPSSFALMALGLGMIGWLGARRRKQ